MNNVSTNKEFSDPIGNTYQLYGTKHYKLENGDNNNVRCIDVKTGSGLEYTVVTDRGLDISWASYKGSNVTYISNNAEVHPSYYKFSGSKWLRTFFAGLLTTCGPTNIGSSCVDQGEEYGLHGEFNVTPGKYICDMTRYSNKIHIKGEIDSSSIFSEKIRINRTIESEIFGSEIKIIDRITNYGNRPIPILMLYHINFGFPLLNSLANIKVYSDNIEAYDDYSREHLSSISTFLPPCESNKEKNYFHKMTDYSGYSYAFINGSSNICAYVKFSNATLPYLSMWKLETKNDYVLALEPCNAKCVGRSKIREQGNLPFIEPEESLNFEVSIGFVEGDIKYADFLK